MADNIIRVNVTSSKQQRVTVSSANVGTEITASPDTGRFWSQTSKNWAVSESIVDGEDYSSKYYANKSKQFAQNAEGYSQSTRETYNTFVSDANDYRSELTELKDAGAVEINEAVASGKDEINSTKTTIINDIEFVADGEKKEIEDLADLIKENAEEIASRTSFAMFDTVLKDHILTYEESKGLALQGTYVYKEAIAGSRYGYPDFYAKCLEEYNEATEEMPFIQLANPNGVTSSSGFSNANNAFDGDTSTYASCGTSTDYIEWDLGQTLTISGFSVTTAYESGKARACNVAMYSVDSNNTETLLANGSGVAAEASGTSTASFNPVSVKKLRFKLIPADNGNAITTQYPSRVTEINIIATVPTWKKNPNGHIFYDISLKDQIDEMFTSTGMAWMYGIDTENERVFLPRDNEKIHGTLIESYKSGNNWYRIYSDGWCEQGHRTANIQDTTVTWTFLKPFINTSYNVQVSCVGSSSQYTTVRVFGTNTTSCVVGNFGINKAGKGNVDCYACGYVEIPTEGVKNPKNLYICVGNTEAQSAVTDVVDVTTTENDTTPLFTGMYFDFTPNNISWLKSGEQKRSSGVYTFCYNELVKELTLPKYNLKVINESDMIVGVDYSEFWKVNQDNMTFTTPTAISNKALSGAVIGNGMTLGLTNGVDLGLYTASDSYVRGQGVLFGSSIGANASGSNVTNNKSLGVSTDSTKSGIIAEQSTSQLYFKVANAVQNLELLDAGEVLEAVNNVVPNNRTVWDGQWVGSTLQISTSKANGTYNLDLSDYLPKDNYNYEVKVSVLVDRSSSGRAVMFLSSSIIPKFHFTTSGNACTPNTGTDNIAIGVDRKLTMIIETNAFDTVSLNAVAYRRLGTNQ